MSTYKGYAKMNDQVVPDVVKETDISKHLNLIYFTGLLFQGSFLEPADNSNLQRVYKVVFVGDSGVGKSSFIHRYCYEIWKPSYTATIGKTEFREWIFIRSGLSSRQYF